MIPRVDPECNHKCRSKHDAAKLLSVVSKGTEEETLFYLATAGLCAQPGKVVDENGRSLLHLAASVGKKRVVEWLLRFKEAAINAKDHESGYSALHRSIFYGQIHITEYLISCGANAGLCDAEGLTPIDHAVRDQQRYLELSTSNPCDVYTWGTNSNYNLGIGHQQHRPFPDVLENFRRESVFCRFVALQKFHSAFLTSSGQVLTCGHGRGGRLGHGDEESQLTPKLVKALQGQTCVGVALGVDHSLFLTSSGTVWSCGVNAYHQLGHHPPPRLATTPQLVSLSSAKLGRYSAIKQEPALGVAASRFHSLFWTKHFVYTWGLNGGQLGHLKGAEKFISMPKLVSALNQKDFSIRCVCSSDGAVVVLTEGGEIIALHEYQTRRITKHVDVAKIEVVGGHLDSVASVQAGGDEFCSKITDKGGRDLKVFVLSKQGRISVWEEKRGSQLYSCVFNLNRELLIQDISVHRNGLLLLSNDGVGYEGTHQHKHDHSSVSPAGKGKSGLATFVAKTPSCDLIKVKRIPGIFRGTFVASDPKGQNAAILQLLPNASLIEIPEVEASSMSKDMKIFYGEVSEDDQLVDVLFRVGNSVFPAHKYIVASMSDDLAIRMVAMDASERDLEIDDVDANIFAQILTYAYTKTCDLMKPGPCSVTYTPKNQQKQIIKQMLAEPDPGNSTLSAYAVHKANKKTRNGKAVAAKPLAPGNPLFALQETAQRFGVHGLIKALNNFDWINGHVLLKSNKKEPRARQMFSRKSYPELSDITFLATEDNVEISAHKCILAARLDYFKSMFSLGWVETKQGQTLSLPVSSKVLLAVFEYLYKDEVPSVVGSDDTEFVSSMLVVSDQLLIPRLLQVCERQLSQLLTLKNASEILQFAFDYNAIQLQNSAMQFISQNVAAILENRTLAVVSEINLSKLAAYYRKSVLSMHHRMITPNNDTGPTLVEIEEHFAKTYTTMQELFEDEAALLSSATVKQTFAGKKRWQKRRNSSGEQQDSRQRNVSTSSVGSHTSDSGGEEATRDASAGRGSDLSLDDFEFEEKPAASVDSGHAALIESPCSNGNFLRDFFSSSKITSAASDTKGNGNSFGKKFVKKSQKERKKETAIEVATVSEAAAPPEKPKWTGWGKPEVIMAALSSNDSMLSPQFGEPKQQQQPSKPRTKKASWRQLSFTTDAEDPVAASSAPVNPWKKVTVVPELPLSSATFQHILTDQAKQSANLMRSTSKSLAVTQAEERAIEELMRFYNAAAVFDESIRVVRVEEGPLAAPVWNRQRKN